MSFIEKIKIAQAFAHLPLISLGQGLTDEMLAPYDDDDVDDDEAWFDCRDSNGGTPHARPGADLQEGDTTAAGGQPRSNGGYVTHDKVMASTFLSGLDPTATRFTFQTFDDNKDRKSKALARVLHGTLDGCFAELTRLNNLGAGIFITISETNFLGRSTKNIVRPRALFYDADGDEQVTHATTVIEAHDAIPSMTVISGGGRHGYYICDDIPLDQFSALQKSLAAKLGTDPAVHDLPRVMRLPGMLHLKDPNTPRLVKLLQTNCAVKIWKLSDLIDKLGLSQQPRIGLTVEGHPTDTRSRPPTLSSTSTPIRVWARASIIQQPILKKSALPHSPSHHQQLQTNRTGWILRARWRGKQKCAPNAAKHSGKY